jgi:hypothetical protein
MAKRDINVGDRVKVRIEDDRLLAPHGEFFVEVTHPQGIAITANDDEYKGKPYGLPEEIVGVFFTDSHVVSWQNATARYTNIVNRLAAIKQMCHDGTEQKLNLITDNSQFSIIVAGVSLLDLWPDRLNDDMANRAPSDALGYITENDYEYLKDMGIEAALDAYGRIYLPA